MYKAFAVIFFCIIISSESTVSPTDGYFFPAIKDTLSKLLKNATTVKASSLSNECQNSLMSIINDTNGVSSLYLYKMFFESSKNKNDMMSFSSCMRERKYENEVVNTTYLVVTVSNNYTNDTMIIPDSYSFGLCLPKQCNETEYFYLFESLNNTNSEIFNLTLKHVYEMFTVDFNTFKVSPMLILNYLPLILLIFQILLTVFTGIPYYLGVKFYEIGNSLLCKKGQSKSEKHMVYLQKKSLLEIKKAFSLKENSEELFNSKTSSSKINNESGLTYIKGLRGISMLFMIIGNFFILLVHSPSYIYSETTLNQLLKSWKFGFIFYGIRYAPRILLSCSGYTLVYKLMCFLDDKVDESLEEEEEKIEINTISNTELKENSQHPVEVKKEEEHDDFDDEDPTDENVHPQFLLTFYLYQIHKYFIVIFVILFVRFTMYPLQLLISNMTPLWEHLNHNILSQCGIIDILQQIFLVKPILFFNILADTSELTKSQSEGLLLDYFWLINNEIVFFLLTGGVIYLCYKYKYSLNHYVIGMWVFIIIIRILIVFINSYRGTQYTSNVHFGRYFISAINNYPYYLVGVYFGLINYALQKGISADEAASDQRDYLFSPIQNVLFYNNKPKSFFYSYGFIILAVIVAASLSQGISIRLIGINEIADSSIMNYLYQIDIDIVLLALHWILFGFYIKGDNFVNQIISLDVWGMWNKLYFSFCLSLPSVTLYFIYHSNNRIYLTFGNIFFYSIIVTIFTLTASSILYLLFELPYKRVIKFWQKNKMNRTKNIIENNGNLSATRDFSRF